MSKVNLGRSVEAELLRSPMHPLSEVPPFLGAGIYAIYYIGDAELYRPLSGSQTPIYVGKAAQTGARKGQVDPEKEGHELWDRIDEHRASIDAVENLEVAGFNVRYLVADELFIPLAERLMLRGFQPLWNVVVDGFGNHDPGAGRYRGARPSWDELHPGRKWNLKMPKPSMYSADVSVERIKMHFERVPPVIDVDPLALLPAPSDIDALSEGSAETGPLSLFDGTTTSPRETP
nr:Eco29kI family restriction endonuclease [Modestobacter versicolor]